MVKEIQIILSWLNNDAVNLYDCDIFSKIIQWDRQLNSAEKQKLEKRIWKLTEDDIFPYIYIYIYIYI